LYRFRDTASYLSKTLFLPTACVFAVLLELTPF